MYNTIRTRDDLLKATGAFDISFTRQPTTPINFTFVKKFSKEQKLDEKKCKIE